MDQNICTTQIRLIPDYEINITYTNNCELTIEVNVDKGFVFLINETIPEDILQNAMQSDRILFLQSNIAQTNYEEVVLQNNLTRAILYVEETEQMVFYNIFTKRLQQFDANENVSIETIENIFKEKNFNGYSVSTTLFENVPTSLMFSEQGIDFQTLKVFAKKFNFNVTYHLPGDGDLFGIRHDNGSTTGSIKELYERTSLIAFNQMFVKSYNAPDLEMSNVIFSDRLCIVVGKSTKIPLISPLLSGHIQIGILIVLIISVIVLIPIRMFNNLIYDRKKLDVYFTSVGMDVLQMLLNSVRHRSISRNFSARIYIGALLSFAMIYNTIIQSVLSMIATKPPVPIQIETLEDLAHSPNDLITSTYNLKDIFRYSDMAYMKILDAKLRIKRYDIRDYKLHSYLTRETKIEYEQILGMKSIGSLNYHKVKECAESYLLAYMFRKELFFKADFNRMLLQLFESGLIRKWHSDVMIRATYANVTATNANISTIHFVQKSVKNLLIPSFILCVGYVFAVCVFLLECCLKKWQNKESSS